jgi:tRNA-2-methylthio-N6-dimethylallyladenosine synthase
MSKRKQVNLPLEEVQEQDKYIEQMHRINEDYFNKTGKRRLISSSTYGCPRVQVYTI